MGRATDPLVLAGTVEAVRAAGRVVVPVGRTRVLVLPHGEGFVALDDRCPHMGFPLSQGDVHDGLLDCHWHHARFDVTCGATLDPWADDAASYKVEVKDGRVFVDPTRPPRDPQAHGLARLQRGLEDDQPLVIAKAVIELLDGGVDPREAVALGARYGSREREDGWQPGLSILAAMANVLPALEPEDKARALTHALVHVADDCAGKAPRRPLEPLEGSRHDAAALTTWFRETVEVRDAQGAERVLRTIALRHGAGPALHAVLAAATDHRYSAGGHVLDYAVKCAELSDHLGEGADPEDRADLFTSLVPGLVAMERMEETSAWRRPVDVAFLVSKSSEGISSGLFSESASRPPRPLDDEEAVVATLLGEDPAASVGALRGRLDRGASPVSLADAVVAAAIERVLSFGTSNEVPDWDTVHHTLTYANAVAEAMRRAPSPELFRAVLDAAMSVYLDRFLNVPPAPRLRPTAPSGTADAALADLLATYDRRAAVETATKGAHAYLARPDASPDRLLSLLGHVVLREDSGFHPFQQLDIAWRLLERRGPSPRSSSALTSVARWLAAQFPTRRARDQTFLIARRLSRGESLHAS